MKRTTRDDESRLNVLLAELANDSLKKGESKEQWRERLEALREVIDNHIDVAEV